MGEWLKKQAAAASGRDPRAYAWRLLRSGGLTVDQFANNKGAWLTLDQLREKNAAAFRRAGL
jgi:hypothetical protein